MSLPVHDVSARSTDCLPADARRLDGDEEGVHVHARPTPACLRRSVWAFARRFAPQSTCVLSPRECARCSSRSLQHQAVDIGDTPADALSFHQPVHLAGDGDATVTVFEGVEARAALLVLLVLVAVGVLGALDPAPGADRFTPDDARILESFGSSGATAVATGKNVAKDVPGAASKRPRPNAAAGHGSCTTRRSRTWRASR